MLKLTIPTQPNLYKELAQHPNVVRVVVLSGGYSRDEANKLLKDNDELIASFSRALASDLRASQSQEEFDKALGDAVDSIYDASVNKKLISTLKRSCSFPARPFFMSFLFLCFIKSLVEKSPNFCALF